MSIVGNNVITRLNYCQKDVGRKFKLSKQYHQWEFSLNGEYHKVELFHSFVSGRKKLVVDGDYILKDDSYFKNFKFEFEIDGKIVELKQTKINEYDLIICGKSFKEMKKEEIDGVFKDSIEQKIEELKKNNEYNKPYNNKRNIKYEEHDFELEEEEDEEEYENENDSYRNEKNYNSNSISNNKNNDRNDDDFYKSDGNNFDFSNTTFEKNKKILQNFDFFGDDDNNNNCNNNNFVRNMNNNQNNRINNLNNYSMNLFDIWDKKNDNSMNNNN